MKKYWHIWLKMTSNSFQTIIASRFGMTIFVFGKLYRLALNLGFTYFLLLGAKRLVGYDQNQVLLFLLTYIFLGSLGQMLFREAYRFRRKLVTGEFDFDLVKPVQPLFKNLTGGFDLLDLLTMPVILYLLIKVIATVNLTTVNLLLYLALMLNGLFIILAIHILVLAFGVVTTEVDNAIMVYRDLETMGRFPVDIYKEPLKLILTFVVPVGIMFTTPARGLLGLLNWPEVGLAALIGLTLTVLSLRVWAFALRRYSSASS
ncbi:ABC-2 family transporter protein [Candidatus Microgenomates bacterium]|nr:ABC-2 family transporter protein [Candidatus Microgenomates bacterium]